MTTVVKYNGTLAIGYPPGAGASERIAQPGDVVSFTNDNYAAALVARGDHSVTASSPTVPPSTPAAATTFDQRLAQIEADLAAWAIAPSTPTDGQLPAWSAALGKWTAVNPTGIGRLAGASNTTGVVTAASATAGVGAAVDIPGTAITVPVSSGLPVALKFGALLRQTAAGIGVALLNLVDTTSAATVIYAAYMPLPNNATVPACYFTLGGEFDVGVIAAPRTYKLSVQAWTIAGNNATVNAQNQANGPSYLRAIAGG